MLAQLVATSLLRLQLTVVMPWHVSLIVLSARFCTRTAESLRDEWMNVQVSGVCSYHPSPHLPFLCRSRARALQVFGGSSYDLSGVYAAGTASDALEADVQMCAVHTIPHELSTSSRPAHWQYASRFSVYVSVYLCLSIFLLHKIVSCRRRRRDRRHARCMPVSQMSSA